MTAEGARVRGQRETEILRIATRLFQLHGFKGTPVTLIAREAGMTPANLYWYFPSKQHLLRAVLLELYRSTLDALVAADEPDADATTRLRTFVRAFVQYQLDAESGEQARFSYVALQSSLDPDAAAEILDWQRRHRQMLSEIVTQGVAEGAFQVPDVSVAVSMVLTSSEYVFLWFREDGRLNRADVAEIYAELCLRIVGASELVSREPGD